MCGSMVDIQSPTAEIRRGKKKKERSKPQGKNIVTCPITWSGHKKKETTTAKYNGLPNLLRGTRAVGASQTLQR